MESLSDAGGRGVGVRAFVDGRWGYAYATDLSEEGLRDVGTRRARGGGGGRPRRVGRAARALRGDAGGGPRLARSSAAGPPSGRSSWRSRSSGPRAPREGVTQVEATRLLGRGGVGGARELARLRGRLRRHPGLGLRVGVRGRGQRPHDRPGRGAGPRPGGARPRGDRRRGGRARARARRARASRRAAAARWCSTRSWPPRSWRSSAAMLSADAVQRGRSLFAGPRGRGGGGPGARAGGRRHRPRGPGQRAVRRRGLGHAGARR